MTTTIQLDFTTEQTLLLLIDQKPSTFMRHPFCVLNVDLINFPNMNVPALNGIRELNKPYVDIILEWVEEILGVTPEQLAEMADCMVKEI